MKLIIVFLTVLTFSGSGKSRKSADVEEPVAVKKETPMREPEQKTGEEMKVEEDSQSGKKKAPITPEEISETEAEDGESEDQTGEEMKVEEDSQSGKKKA